MHRQSISFPHAADSVKDSSFTAAALISPVNDKQMLVRTKKQALELDNKKYMCAVVLTGKPAKRIL